MLRKIIFAAVVFAVAALSLSAGNIDPPSAYIPPLRGTTFAGVLVHLPEAFAGGCGILVIGFSRESQGNARVWGKRLAQRYPSGSGVLYYEMPVLVAVPALLRGWVLGRIRDSVSTAGREHFLPVLDHEAAWKQAAGAARDPSVLLVDGQGEVRWRTHGSATDATFAELERQVDLLKR